MRVSAVLKRMQEGTSGPATWEKRYLRKDGSLTWTKLTVSPQHDAEGSETIHFIAIVEDINTQKAAEQRLSLALRMRCATARNAIAQPSSKPRSALLTLRSMENSCNAMRASRTSSATPRMRSSV